MLSGIMLIIVTMFAVLGAYYLSDLLTGCLFKSNAKNRVAVLLATERVEDVWNGVLDLRARIPQSTIVILCQTLPDESQRLEPSMQGVLFATADTLADVVCRQLAVEKAKPACETAEIRQA